MKRILISTVQFVASRIPGWLMPKKFKYTAEYWFWKTRVMLEGPDLANAFYEEMIVEQTAALPDSSFVDGKVIADFGCGPRGSLCWAKGASRRIGIDVLVDQYRKLGIEKHNMEYVKSTETEIPLETDEVDIMVTVNAIDHVMDFPAMCDEICRILKPGGMLIASINLDEAPTFCEPQTLTIEMVEQHLLSQFSLDRKDMQESHKGRKLRIRGTHTPAPKPA